jgi:hypothetical protein
MKETHVLHVCRSKVVQYLEQNYATAGSDKADIEGEANAYLVSALTTVAKDIESVAGMTRSISFYNDRITKYILGCIILNIMIPTFSLSFSSCDFLW